MEICKTCLQDVDLPAIGSAKKGTCDVCHSTDLFVMTTSKEKYENALHESEGGGLDPSLQATLVSTDETTITHSDTNPNGIRSITEKERVPIRVPTDPSAVIAYKSSDGKLFLTKEEKDEYESGVVEEVIQSGVKQVGDDLVIGYSSLNKIQYFITIEELVKRIGEMPMEKEVTRDTSNQ